MPDALVLQGKGRYADPWHDFAATSARIAEVLRGAGLSVRISGAVDDELASLDGVDLLVVNAGNPAHRPSGSDLSDPSTLDAVRTGLDQYVRSGRPLWVFHTAIASLAALPQWADLVGGRWIPGVSRHPPIGEAHVDVAGDGCGITAGLGGFRVWDERYTHLQVDSSVEPLAWHQWDGQRHPLVWTRQVRGARVVYDALGHGVESYASPERTDLMRRCLGWLLHAETVDSNLSMP